jgi:glycosyltransferase involved in cell wall biosynthesis
MNTQHVLVSIGLPVFNGGNFVSVAIESILRQTYPHFELIICDNASTDSTEEICRRYALADKRIRYYRNGSNIGGPRNFNKTFELSRGKYFKWAHHDDVIEPCFLERCVEILERDESVILVHSNTARIEDDGTVIGAYDHDMRVDVPDARERFHDLLMVRHWCYEQFGLFRSSALKQLPLFGNYIASDRRFMAELALLGPWVIIPEYLFMRRQHAEACSNIWPLQARAAWFDPNSAGQITFPYFKEVWEYVKAIKRTAPSLSLRLACCRIVGCYAWAHRRGFLEDIHIAAVMYLNRRRLGRALISTTKRIAGKRIKAEAQ